MEELSQRWVVFLEARFEVAAVWLFGSQARGNARRDSGMA
jgi:predicted nucleotidyltransferase